jgi:predicted DsbA family dithiol-disulfide isomerase
LIKKEFGPVVKIVHKSFILRPVKDPQETFTERRRESWSRVGQQEESGKFNLWGKGGKFPTHSLPALEAAKCMEEQGEELMEEYHFLLLRAFFEENRDISDPDILLELAGTAGADLKAFGAAFQSGDARAKVFDDDRLAKETYRIDAVPTIVIAGKERLVGAVPRALYREAIQKILAQKEK